MDVFKDRVSSTRMKLKEKKREIQTRVILRFAGIALSLGLALLVAYPVEPAIQWKKIASQEEGFSIYMPDLPQKKSVSPVSQNGEQIIRYDSIFEDLPWYSVLFNLAILRFPEETLKGKTPRELFDQITGPARANRKWILENEEAVTYRGVEGVDIKLRVPPFGKYGRSKIRARLFVQKDRVYLLQTTYVPKTFLFSRIKGSPISKFFHSFKITSLSG